MCGKAKSSATPSRIAQIINDVLAEEQSTTTSTENIAINEDYMNNNQTLDVVDNIIPGQNMYVAYISEDNNLLIEEMKWGLYGFGSSTGITFNTRIETLVKNRFSRKNSVKHAIVVIDGYYENQKEKNTVKNKYFITNKTRTMVVPVLFEVPPYGLNVFTIVTKAKNTVGAIHDRQPVTLNDKLILEWLTM